MGDPAGVGPEVVVRALQDPAVRNLADCLLFGDPVVFAERARVTGVALEFAETAPGLPAPAGAVGVCQCGALTPGQRTPGRPTRAGAEVAYRAIVGAVSAALAGRLDAVVTAPVSKEGLAVAGHRVPGHTELLARLTGARTVRMMMAGTRLRVVLVTTHVPLGSVPALLSRSAVARTIAMAERALREWFAIDRPRIAVCGLNPHAGEGGLFGREEQEAIGPAVETARRQGIRVAGPLAADSVFALAAAGRYDAVVCMYHDQGLGAFKLMHFRDGVNVTLGLPFVRTSPDHGTAYDIAPRAVADAGSMVAAIRMAAALARHNSARERRGARGD